MRSLPATPPGRLGVFTADEARHQGWTRSALEHAVRTGRLHRLRPGVFVSAETLSGAGPDSDRRRHAIAVTGSVTAMPQAVASHASAAVLAGLPVWTLPTAPCLTVVPRYTGDTQGVHLHRASLRRDDLARHVVLRRTSVARTVIDIAREQGIESAAVTGDAALAEAMLTPAALAACVAACARWPGIRRARPLLGLLDGRSESPLETVSRLRLAASGVPAPELQTAIVDLRGVLLGRVDLYWDEWGVAGEVDGRLKYDGGSPAALYEEKLRQERLESAGLIVVRWGMSDLRNVMRLQSRLESAFARGAQQARSERRWLAFPATAAGLGDGLTP